MMQQALKLTQPDTGADAARWIDQIREVTLFADIRELPGALESLCEELEERDFEASAQIIGEGRRAQRCSF